jgi:hypothetical protein
MKTKQYNIKAFEIEVKDSKDFYSFIEKNLELLKRFLLVLKGNVTPPIRQYLNNIGLSYIIKDSSHQNVASSTSSSTNHFAKKSGFKIVNNIVRSGQEIIEDRDILILNRVNNGATIQTKGNCIALGAFDGELLCNGEFLMVKPSKKAKIYFNGVDITKELDSESFYIVTLENNEIVISPYTKDIRWE